MAGVDDALLPGTSIVAGVDDALLPGMPCVLFTRGSINTTLTGSGHALDHSLRYFKSIGTGDRDEAPLHSNYLHFFIELHTATTGISSVY